MDNQIIRRIAHGLGANIYGQTVVMIIQLVGIPILLHYWGPHLYGEWLILFAIPAYLSMTDLGFSQSAANDMTARVSRGDHAGVLVVFQSLSALVYLVVAYGILSATLLIVFLPIQNWFHFIAIQNEDVRWILWLLAVEVFVTLINGINHAGFRANGEYHVPVSINYTTLLLQQMGVWLAACLGYGPLTAAAWFVATRIVVTPAVTLLLFRRHKFLKFGFTYASLSTLRELLRPALANIAIPLAQAINIQGMTLAVGALLGPLAVVTFTTLRTLTRLIVRTIQSVNNAMEPELARAWGVSDIRLMNQLYVHGLRASLWLVLLAVATLYFLGGWVLNIWTNGKVLMNWKLFDWLLLSAAASVLWYGSLTLLKAVNQHLPAAIWYVVSSLVAIVIAVLMMHSTGQLSDAGLALLVMDLLMAAYLLRKANMLAGLSVSRLFRLIFDPRVYLRLIKIEGMRVN